MIAALQRLVAQHRQRIAQQRLAVLIERTRAKLDANPHRQAALKGHARRKAKA